MGTAIDTFLLTVLIIIIIIMTMIIIIIIMIVGKPFNHPSSCMWVVKLDVSIKKKET